MSAEPIDPHAARRGAEETSSHPSHPDHQDKVAMNDERRAWRAFAEALKQSANRPPWWSHQMTTYFGPR